MSACQTDNPISREGFFPEILPDLLPLGYVRGSTGTADVAFCAANAVGTEVEAAAAASGLVFGWGWY